MTPETETFRRDPEWLRLVALLRGRRLLLERDFTSRFDGAEVYGGKVPRDEVDALVSATMEMYLVLLSGEPLSPELHQLPTQLGRRRARQGVPAELLLEGVRTNSRVIWNALRMIAGAGEAACLVRNADAILGLVEWHVREVQRSYLHEQEALQRSSERRRRRAISLVFDLREPSREEILELAGELDLAPDGDFDVVTDAGLHDGGSCTLCVQYGRTVFVHESSEGTCHFRPASDDDLLGALSGMNAALLTGVAGLRGIRDADRAGRHIVRSRSRADSAPGPVTLEDAWPGVAWRALAEVVPADLMPIDLRALRALHPASRDRLVETVDTFLATGSIKTTSELLFCHRNTVVKRLAAFEDLVGLDLGVPRQAALAVLVLAAPLEG